MAQPVHSSMLNATLPSSRPALHSSNERDKGEFVCDNSLSDCETESDVVSYYEEARSTMVQGKFNLRSWASNSKQFHSRTEKDNANDTSSEVCVLGLRWDPTNDTIALTQKSGDFTKISPMTKRSILRQSAKVYDPLGIIALVTVRARILIQELWRRNFP